MLTIYEFFSGGRMARARPGEAWTCLFANDIDAKKGMRAQVRKSLAV
jgi:DNA (cytosine-5)-methyltransferase 1